MQNGVRPKTTGQLIGERLEWERSRRNLSWNDIVRLSGLSPTYLYGLRNGNFQEPKPTTVRALASALGISVEELASGPPAGDGLPSDIAEAKRRLDEVVQRARETLPPAEVEAVVASIEAHLAALKRMS